MNKIQPSVPGNTHSSNSQPCDQNPVLTLKTSAQTTSCTRGAREAEAAAPAWFSAEGADRRGFVDGEIIEWNPEI